MENFKYFRRGLPDNPKAPVYALYQPMLDCFLAVFDNLELARQVQLIASSRYTTYVCLLNTADNFYPKVIDNEICENWSFTNKDPTQFIQLDFLSQPPHLVEELCNSNLPQQDLINLDKEKQWLLMCRFWINFVNNTNFKISRDLEKILNTLPSGIESYHTLTDDFEREILTLLYLGIDFEKTDQQILNIVESVKLTGRVLTNLNNI
jgi:hypothetical protein